MNEFTLLFCWLPIAMAVGIVSLPILGVLSKLSSARAKQAETQARADARERALKIKEGDAERKAALHEAKMAVENNKAVLQDIKIEAEKLRLLKLEREARISDPDSFKANYPHAGE